MEVARVIKPSITIELSIDEVSELSLILDQYIMRIHAGEYSREKRLQQKWDRIYRSVHALSADGITKVQHRGN